MGIYISVNEQKFSHEFNTSLTGILSNAELLQSNKLSPEQATDCIKDIYKSGKTLLTLINSLLHSTTQTCIIDNEEYTSHLNLSKINNLRIRKSQWLSVLVVEDEPIIQRVHRNMLEELGCYVEIAKDGFEALKMLAGELRYDVIFMDIGLPKMNGIQTVEKIRGEEINKSIPIIGLTAYQIEQIKEQCRIAGFNNIVSKPITSFALKNILYSLAKEKINYKAL